MPPRRVAVEVERDLTSSDYEDLPELAGIVYRGAHESGRCVVAWERTGALAFDSHDDRPLDDRLVWPRVLVALDSQGRAAERTDCDRCRACGDAGLTTRIRPV